MKVKMTAQLRAHSTRPGGQAPESKDMVILMIGDSECRRHYQREGLQAFRLPRADHESYCQLGIYEKLDIAGPDNRTVSVHPFSRHA